MDPFTVESTFPPSLQGAPILAMFIVMGFLAIVLVILRWIYEIVDGIRDMPAPRGSYIRISRGVRLRLLLSSLIIALPRLAQLMLWQRLDAAERGYLSAASWLAVIPCAILIIRAWWFDKRLVATEIKFVQINGFVAAPPATAAEKRQGVVILLLILVIAFATTFVRSTDDARPPLTVVERPAG